MKQYIILSVLIFLFGSCDSFLKEYSQDLAYAETITDLEEVLIGNGYLDRGTSFKWLHTMDDDLEESVVNSNYTDYENFFIWASYPCTRNNTVYRDETWVTLYKNISAINVVLSKLKDISDFPEEVERLRGECHFLRGFYYYFLVNTYAKPYVKESASTDLGVPLKTTEYIEDIYFKRNTVEETYALITSDLEASARLLKGKAHQSGFQANYHAVQAFLSRVYLYLGEYEAALQAADSVLQGDYALLDYNEFAQTVASPADIYGIHDIVPVDVIHQTSVETIFTQGAGAFAGNISAFGIAAGSELARVNRYKASEDLVQMYSKEQDWGTDLRPTFFMYVNQTDPTSKRYIQKQTTSSLTTASSEFLLRLPEVLLNKAEALAMLGKDAEAMAVLEELRVKRIVAAEYKELDARSGKKLIELIRDERRRELCGEGHRWFDLRRYAVHPKYPSTKEIVHDHYFYDNSIRQVTYVGSYKLNMYESEPAYVIPIPQHVIEFNKGNMVDNETRPDREAFIRF
ncbi:MULTISPECIES: RagB/SusD family nutrient uptake outer membrane protein [Butyricimonas]|uniref:RagB/SusD family nutrient uptake outer membrane protein n=1 Tax=Butyricimonas TaxID=574697 RepID=UPI00242BEEFC|nr:RagB/SusD family nutrient uptake outer membrane protein [Butyricimonas paravirosa]